MKWLHLAAAVMPALLGCAQSGAVESSSANAAASGSGGSEAGSGGDATSGPSTTGDGGAGETSTGTESSTGGQAPTSSGETVSSSAQTGASGQTVSSSSGGGCVNPLADCPPTGTACQVPVCSAGACSTSNTNAGTACADGGGVVCDGAGTCVPPTCTDGIQNGAELGVDCGGGTCGGCPDGTICAQPGDCQSGACLSSMCAACGDNGQPCCPGSVCDAAPDTCVENSFTLWGGTSQECNCGLLRPGQMLLTDDSRWSCDGRFQLVMQNDGNLVLYYSGVGPLWSSNTTGTGSTYAVIQSDGNFVVYDAGGVPWWATDVTGFSDAFVGIQDDGNLVVYDGAGTAHWASDTCCF